MSLIHADSAECGISQLDLFNVPPTQISLRSGRYNEYKPLGSLDQLRTSSSTKPADLEFKLEKTNVYRDFRNSALYLQVQILKSDGTKLKKGTDNKDPAVALINLAGNTIFQQTDIYMNKVLITQSTNTTPYRTYIEHQLCYNQDAKESQLTSFGYSKDLAGLFDSTALTGTAANTGFVYRQNLSKDSKIVELTGIINCDLFNQARYIPGHIPIDIKLTRASDAFCLIADADEYMLNIKSAVFIVREIALEENCIRAHQRLLQTHPYKFPIKKVETKSFNVTPDCFEFEINSISSRVPNFMAVAFVDGNAYSGSMKKNPFNFQHFNINKIEVNLAGNSQPHAPISLDFENKSYIRAFNAMFTNKTSREHGNDIDRNDFADGYTIFCFEFTPDLSSGDHFDIVRYENLVLRISFKKVLDRAINCLTYLEFDSIITYDKYGVVVQYPK